MLSRQSSKAWGLYTKDTSNAVPLKNLDISITIFHSIARVTYSQEYFNDRDMLIETEFFFPISPDACFDSFQAIVNNTTIKGIVKEKEKAKEEYKEAIEQGRTAAYSEINKETGDIMKIQIGNIPQNTNISIIYSYVQKLETTLNRFWCFRLFSTLTPRYNNMSNLKDFLSSDVDVLSSYPTIAKDNVNAYPWKIQAEIHSPSPITFVKSPSHETISTYGNEKHTCSVSLNPQTKHFPNKDFILLYSNGKEGGLDYLLTPFEDGYCAMVSMIADFDKGTDEQAAFENFVKGKEAENNGLSMSTIRGEYIFLIDRSGSMSGDRITIAKNSLVLFLKSLPKDSFFNVVSFGSSFTFLHNSSIAYSQESIDYSAQQIQSFIANMGGTEIHSALQTIFNNPPKQGYPRFVFLLTDGAVSNTQQVLDLILSNNNTTRTFTIGIGNGCSPELITKGAACGRGKEEFVTDNNQIFEKVISLLNASLSPCYSDLSLHADNFDAVVKSVSPNPTSIPFLINGQTMTFFLFLRKEAFQDSQQNIMKLQLRMYDSRIQKQRTLEVCLDTTQAFDNDLVSKLAIHDMIKRLENEEDNKNKEIMWMTKEDLKQELLEYSLKYGILCQETAFFCEISDNGGAFEGVVPTEVIIPTALSQDYETDHTKRRRRGSAGSRDYICGCGGSYLSYPALYTHIKTKHNGVAPMGTSHPPANGKSGRGRPKKELDQYIADNMEEEVGTMTYENQAYDSNADIAHNPEKLNSILKQKKPSNNSLLSSAHQQQEFLKSDIPLPSSRLNNSYLDIIMKQKFEGSWGPSDQQIKQIILNNPELSQLPTQIQVNDPSQADAIWITILILRWLEIACNNDRKTWLLIYRKGCEWLKEQGVDYETVKELGTSSIKV